MTKPHAGVIRFRSVATTRRYPCLRCTLLYPGIDVRDVIMVMDADSVITTDFLATALGRLENEPDVIAVGGVFNGERGGGIIGQLQRNEFSRYQRYISRRKAQPPSKSPRVAGSTVAASPASQP